ncbi:hypothetical protein F4818DRAFT_121087 [Hypoxylon cercidicola]|nr:hypothetical protein F4818DRAFT_121087 [Hypoxylon cercidicola]
MAATTSFTPYWRAVGAPAGPNSWVFFVVAQINGRHRPIAVVSSVGDTEPEESIQGYPLTACCRRIVTIFADPSNHAAIRAELALAAGYHAREGDRERSLEPVELLEFNRFRTTTRNRRRPWDRTRVHEFPFIAACLLQGVGFDAQLGRTPPVRPEPLATVYRDTSIEWGMVVVDITELDVVRYGIVGFNVSKAKFVPSREVERRPVGVGAMGPGVFEPGELRVMDDVRPRRPMSAAEYMAKFNYEASAYGNAGELLARIPLVDEAAMSLVWPPSSEDDIHPPLSADTHRTFEEDQVITRLVRATTSDLEDFDMSIFDEVRAIPNFQDLLRHSLIEHSDWLGSAPLAGQLIRLAFANHEHLSLEQLEGLSAESMSAVLEVSEMEKITSISLCIDSIRSTPAQLVDVLSRADTLREIYLLQSPTRENDAPSVQFFEELAARPQILSRANVMLAGAYSAALRQAFWLPTVSNSANAAQLAPLEVFPVQQILVRHQLNPSGNIKFDHDYVYLGDGLLKPEHFATGFLLYLSTLMPSDDDIFNSKAQLFSFSSGPASLAADPLSSARVSPILAENFALPIWLPHSSANYWPRMRDLVPGGWTVIVSQEMYRNSESYYIRYAFIRPRHQRIMIDRLPRESPGQEELEVVGLKEFLSATAPEVDPVVIDRRLHEVAEKLASGRPYWRPLPPDVEPLSVLNQAEAAGILLDFLQDAKALNKRLREAMKESPEGEFSSLTVS